MVKSLTKRPRALAGFIDEHAADGATFAPLIGGQINKIHLVELRDGRRFVLRQYGIHKVRDAILYEHRLLGWLPDHIRTAAIAAPVVARNGESVIAVDGTQFALFPFLDGDLSACDDVAVRLQAGQILAAYHNIVWAYHPIPLARPGFGTVANLDWVASNAGSVRRLLERCAEDNPDVRGMCEVIQRELRRASDVVQIASRKCPHLVLHHDFGPHNVLLRNDIIVALLDFDLASWDLRCFDVAIAIMWFAAAHLRTTGRFEAYEWEYHRDAAVEFLRGYASTTTHPLSRREYDMLPVLMRAFCVWLLLWHLDRRVIGEQWLANDIDGLAALLFDMSNVQKAAGYELSDKLL